MEHVITSKVERKMPLPNDVTFEAFLEWADEDTRAEWLHGEIIYHSRALAGFRLRPDWLWQEPLPKVLNVARELGFLD